MIDVEGRKKMKCPFNGATCLDGWRKDFGEEPDGERMKCRLWTHVHVKDPFSEQIVEMWDCSQAWSTTIMADASQKAMQTAASVQDFRNVFVDSLPEETQIDVLQKTTRRMLQQATDPKLNQGQIDQKKLTEAAQEVHNHMTGQGDGNGTMASPKIS